LIVSGFDPAIEQQLASYVARKESSHRSFKHVKRNYKGTVKATKKPFSKFILFEFDDGSSEYVIDIDAKEYCDTLGIKNDKFLDYVYNFYTATITI